MSGIPQWMECVVNWTRMSGIPLGWNGGQHQVKVVLIQEITDTNVEFDCELFYLQDSRRFYHLECPE